MSEAPTTRTAMVGASLPSRRMVRPNVRGSNKIQDIAHHLVRDDSAPWDMYDVAPPPGNPTRGSGGGETLWAMLYAILRDIYGHKWFRVAEMMALVQDGRVAPYTPESKRTIPFEILPPSVQLRTAQFATAGELNLCMANNMRLRIGKPCGGYVLTSKTASPKPGLVWQVSKIETSS